MKTFDIFVENLFKKNIFFAQKLFSLMKTSDIFVENLVKKTFFWLKTFFPDEEVWYFRRKFG